ncbi:MAG: exodeoxyribonuclease VII small subunit [Steroidobacteraceae bacterium]|nr:exodeoxyribonuclease VII small subunit [Steroidobacteraceae bacterium]MDW8259286.1 exodeoxyribonuclease VII small subunit [Gammaproteobacteria bacterium]
MSASRRPPDFEKSLKELEQLVERLEHGELALEEALKAFERGVQLARNCQEALRNAQSKVAILTEGENGPQLRDFQIGAEGQDDASPP